ncbi:CCR4-NOT core subunit cdc39 [Mucor velutinosus]|uniref:CCR4-NOT core subunit cdc39 n=1 Tax=Mucor velutinosus TaxID=708070 RepID=A0AAN7DJZ5_9FUNG|nr:CCR4-NOT core subunit cdc39 [Mucor velutinosus]
MATIYHEYGPGDKTYVCPQQRQIRRDSEELRHTVRRLSESGLRRESEQRRKSEVISERASVIGSVQSMRQGKLPSNEQLNRAMDRLLSSKSIETNKQHMSADGQLLLKDFQELLLTFQRALQTKNRDELFQSMIYHVKKSEASLSDIKPNIEGDVQHKEEGKGDAQMGAKAILKIAKLFLFNSQFRGVLNQILNIAQQTMGGVLQEGGKAISDHADSETSPASLKDKVRNAASKVTDNKNESSPHDQSTMKDKIHNAAAGMAGGAAVGGSASQLASKHHDETDNQRSQTESHSRDIGSHLPKDHQRFLEHRFIDSELGAPATDDAGHTIDQDIEHGAVPHPNSNFVAGSKIKQPLDNQSPQSDGSPIDEQVYLNNPSSIHPSTTGTTTQRAATKAPTAPQHQVFMANPSALHPTATEPSSAVGGMPTQAASAIPTSTANDLQRSESPSSFTDMGKMGNADPQEFKHEQFYGNHMGVYTSALNQPKSRSAQDTQPVDQAPSASPSTNDDTEIRRRLNAAVPKYAPGAKPTSEDYIQSRFDAPAGGGNTFLHKRLNAAVPHSAMDAGQVHPMSSVGMDGYVPSSSASYQQQQPQQTNSMRPDLNHDIQNDNQDFFHKRLDSGTTPLTSNPTLAPKSHISAGAGYHLKQDNHAVSAKEIAETLTRSSATGAPTQKTADDQVKAHADSFPGQHVMDKLNFATAPGGALVNPQQASSAQSRQMPQPVQDHANDFSGDHAMDRIDGQPKNASYSKAGIGAVGLMAGAGGAAMLNKQQQQSSQQDQADVDDPNLIRRFKAGSPASDDRAGYFDKDFSSSHPAETDASTHSFIPTGSKSAPKLTTKRSSFHEPHQYRGVDGQVHIDDGANTQPIMSNREAVRRMSSGEYVDLNAHPTKSDSGIGAASALGAGTGAAAAVATTHSNEQQSKDASGDQLDKDTRISADKIVNQVKQKTGNQDQSEQEQERGGEEQDSISANEIISKLKEILTTVQKNPEYQQAMSTLMSLFGTWGNRLKTGQMDRRRSSAVPVSEQNEYYRNTAAYEAKAIIEDWAQGKSLDPILRQFTEVSSKLKQDENLKKLMHKIIAYVQRMLQEPGYLSGNESTEEGSKLVEEVRRSALEEYKPQVQSMIQESSGIIKSVSDDPISQKIAEKVKAIHDHLWYDSNKHAAFKPHLLNDMRITLIPALIEQIKFVPLPQIIYSDKQFEIAVENMVLQGDTLMPDIFEVKADDYLRFSPNANVNYTNSQSVHVHMTGIQTTMEDVVFYYRRKAGFPKMSDSGVVSIATGGAGLRVSMRIVSSSVDQRHSFRIDQCHCHIDKLNIKVNHSKHNTLYKVLNPMMAGIVKRQMCKAIENKLITTFQRGDAKITKHLFAQKLSSDTPTTSNIRRPGLFSHLVTLLNQKVSSI